MWPRLANYFGARAASAQRFENSRPQEGSVELEVSLEEWSKDKRRIWDRVCDKSGVPEAKKTWDAGTWCMDFQLHASQCYTCRDNIY